MNNQSIIFNVVVLEPEVKISKVDTIFTYTIVTLLALVSLGMVASMFIGG